MKQALPAGLGTMKPSARHLALSLSFAALVVTTIILAGAVKKWLWPLKYEDPVVMRRMKVESDLENILRVAEGFYEETGRYPNTMDDMINATAANGLSLSVSLAEYPKDPWQRVYVYELIHSRPQVSCLGSDGEVGGGGEARDISRISRR